MACRNEYMIVEPTKLIPRLFKSFEIASDSGDVVLKVYSSPTILLPVNDHM